MNEYNPAPGASSMIDCWVAYANICVVPELQPFECEEQVISLKLHSIRECK